MKSARFAPSDKLCNAYRMTNSSAVVCCKVRLNGVATEECSRVLCLTSVRPMQQQQRRCHPGFSLSIVWSGGMYDRRRSMIAAVDVDTSEGPAKASEAWPKLRDDYIGEKREVSLERQILFNRIAPVYDNVNDWLSLGLHRVWKRMCVSWSEAKAGDAVLDICCGSGDLTFLLAEKVGLEGRVSGVDFAPEQLSVAASRQENSMHTCSARIQWIQGDALALPFQDETFDAITMGYGLRNVASIPLALAEMHRVLKPAQKASILDFNRSLNPLANGVQSWMLDNVVVPVASLLGVKEEYAYLKVSIARFPLGSEQERLAMDAGFSQAEHYELAGGLMGILVVTK